MIQLFFQSYNVCSAQRNEDLQDKKYKASTKNASLERKTRYIKNVIFVYDGGKHFICHFLEIQLDEDKFSMVSVATLTHGKMCCIGIKKDLENVNEGNLVHKIHNAKK